MQGGPGEVALNGPALGKQDEAALGLGQLDDLESDALRLRHLVRRCVGVALVDVGRLDALVVTLPARRRPADPLARGPRRRPRAASP